MQYLYSSNFYLDFKLLIKNGYINKFYSYISNLNNFVISKISQTFIEKCLLFIKNYYIYWWIIHMSPTPIVKPGILFTGNIFF